MSEQMSLGFVEPAYMPAPMARRSDPATSQAAAASAKQLQADHHDMILSCLRRYGALGKDGIASRTHLTGHAVGKRLSELERAGLIEQTGKTVASTAGRQEREWRICRVG